MQTAERTGQFKREDRFSGLMPFPEIAGPYIELATLVRQITGDVPRMTAATRAGVSHDTIARLWQGFRASPGLLVRFAEGYGVDPMPLMEAAGYLAEKTRMPQFEVVGANTKRKLTERLREISDPFAGSGGVSPKAIEEDEAHLIQAYRGLKSGISKRLARSMINELRRLEKEGTIGGRRADEGHTEDDGALPDDSGSNS